MFKSGVFIFFLSLFGFSVCATASQPPMYLKLAHKKTLERWFAENTKYISATDADCDCEDQIEQLRSGYGGRDSHLIKNYHPYYSVGDFNKDGTEDFAVAVKSRSVKDEELAILVFNGSAGDGKDPSFFGKALLRKGHGLFYFSRRKSARLIFGVFESEGCSLEPLGTGYKVNCEQDY